MTKATLDSIKRALEYICADERETCICVGMAIHSELNEDGYRLWDDWLKTGSGYNQDDMRRAWNSFKSGSITIATLFYLAKNNQF